MIRASIIDNVPIIMEQTKVTRNPIHETKINFILGGEEVLLEYGGKDSTEQFDDVGHSQDAKDLLKQYHIGTLVESEKASNKVKAKAETKK